MKRIVSIQDISAVGKCSLTVALPIISAMGTECAILPTAVLSTHTMFKDFTFCDLTEQIEPIAAHWQAQGLSFDALYSGYLGSFRQIELVKALFSTFGKTGKVIVDPAMADNGKLYPGFTPEFALKMGTLCEGADLILPNLTEASFILGREYRESYSRDEIKAMLLELTERGTKCAALTGVSFESGRLGVASYDRTTGEYFEYFSEHLPVAFHGTGDIYSSTVVGAMMDGRSVNDALTIAVDYTVECIRQTMSDPNHNWYGVNFESAIPYLLRRMGKI